MSKLKVDQISKATGASPAIFTLPATDGTSGQYMKTDGSGALSWGTPPDQKITAASIWKLTATHTGNKNPIDADLSPSTNNGQGVLGDVMIETAGVFKFPSTGFWHVTATFTFHRTAADSGAGGFIKSTVNNGVDWNIIAGTYNNLQSTGTYNTCGTNVILDVTDIDNNKVSFQTSHDNTGNSTVGSSTANYTCFTFTRLADT